MALNERIIGELWVCVDCLMAEATGETDDETDREPWNRIGEHETVTNWAYPNGDMPDGETDDGIREFSWSPCDGCGSTLGGSRERYALWAPVKS